jgi:hypothetical protein
VPLITILFFHVHTNSFTVPSTSPLSAARRSVDSHFNWIVKLPQNLLVLKTPCASFDDQQTYLCSYHVTSEIHYLSVCNCRVQGLPW